LKVGHLEYFFISFPGPSYENEDDHLSKTVGRVDTYILLVVKKSQNNHLGCIKPCKKWDKLPISWCRISEPSTAFCLKISEQAHA